MSDSPSEDSTDVSAMMAPYNVGGNSSGLSDVSVRDMGSTSGEYSVAMVDTGGGSRSRGSDGSGGRNRSGSANST